MEMEIRKTRGSRVSAKHEEGKELSGITNIMSRRKENKFPSSANKISDKKKRRIQGMKDGKIDDQITSYRDVTHDVVLYKIRESDGRGG